METNIDRNSSYLNFRIGKECYALSVFRVLEIIQYDQLTHIPNSSEYILGVVNFRGSIVPVIDMHKRFHVEAGSTKDKMVIIVDFDNKESTVFLGLMVDEVTSVFEFKYNDIRVVPDLGINYNPEFLEGIVEVNNDFILVLNVNKVLNIRELAELNEVACSEE